MAQETRHDAWQAGDAYDLYMGRWSRRIALPFLDWLDPTDRLDWLEVGCGTGALSAAILAQCDPQSLVAIEPSDGFLAKARAAVRDTRARFQQGDARALTIESGSKDAIVSALVLNFVPDRSKALAEMIRTGRPGATLAFYVWDYPGGGIEFMRAFWTAAKALDPAAAALAEDRRFPFCSRDGLVALARSAGLSSIVCEPIETPTVFRDFDDFWHPFTLGAGPAPGYCVSLDPDARQRLKDRLRADLAGNADGSIALKARAWAVKAAIA